jgi:hypothetical protein
MVCRADADRAADALSGIGYTVALDGLTRAENRCLEYNTTYCRHGWPSVEIHFRFTDMPGAALDADAFVRRRCAYRTRAGLDVFVLDPVDEFVFLCVHGARHHFEDPKWLRDLELFALKYPRLSWESVSARARELRLETAVWVACQTLRSRLAFQIPDGGPCVSPNPLMRRAWPGIVPDFSSFLCHKRLSWGIRDAVYEAALCDRFPASLLYLLKRAFRFTRREFVRKLGRKQAES